jgi:hypothetical protein
VKRFLACLSLVALASTSATASTTTAPASRGALGKKPAQKHPAAQRPIPAPADEYFGKLKLSILGIRNTIKDVGANIDVDATRAPGLMSKADFAEDAIHDWERHYPTDTWLPKTIFALERMYAKIDSDDGRKRSLAAMTWLCHDYPNTWYAKTGRVEIAQHRVGHPIEAAVTTPTGTTGPAADTAAPSGNQSTFGTVTTTSANVPAATPAPKAVAKPQ